MEILDFILWNLDIFCIIYYAKIAVIPDAVFLGTATRGFFNSDQTFHPKKNDTSPRPCVSNYQYPECRARDMLACVEHMFGMCPKTGHVPNTCRNSVLICWTPDHEKELSSEEFLTLVITGDIKFLKWISTHLKFQHYH